MWCGRRPTRFMSVTDTCVVTYDRDLLALGKPFGIEMVKPAEFLRRLPG